MRIELLDLFAILSLYFFSTILGEEQPAGEQKQGENAGQKIDPMKLIKDSQHIKEHLKAEYGFNDKQADDYLKQYDAQTQFFVMHDYDNNTKLDGLELLKSMTHHHDGDDHGDGHDASDQTDTLVEFVDMVMKDQDLNDDGYIDYPEYINYYTKFDKGSDDGAPGTAKS
ncbi:multiple coagulation factor deficiency protein 2 homolog [Rhopilema esculentum]|uniref:multiple coagulation factor deficiency protein 2 homolog n=1 Tax=Rhopilema esculentum TaxID=499914 RepID=UPI0031DA0239|eukprot:gene12757-3485_t